MKDETEQKVGNYDDEAEHLLHKLNAQGVLVIVMGGQKGHGFSITTKKQKILAEVPHMLRTVAEDIENQNKDRERLLARPS